MAEAQVGDTSALPPVLAILPFRNKVLLPGAIVKIRVNVPARFLSCSSCKFGRILWLRFGCRAYVVAKLGWNFLEELKRIFVCACVCLFACVFIFIFIFIFHFFFRSLWNRVVAKEGGVVECRSCRLWVLLCWILIVILVNGRLVFMVATVLVYLDYVFFNVGYGREALRQYESFALHGRKRTNWGTLTTSAYSWMCWWTSLILLSL